MSVRRVSSFGFFRNAFAVAVALVVAAVVLVGVPASPASAMPMSSNLLFLGDSITAGDCIGEPGGSLKPYYTYRDRFLTDLADGGFVVDSVGWNTSTVDGRGGGSVPATLPGTCFGHPDTEHGSYPGLRADVPGASSPNSLLDNVTDNIGSIAAPDVVLLLAGINDLASGDTPAQVAADLQATVTAVHSASPSAEIFVGTILDHNSPDPDISPTDVDDTNIEINNLLGPVAGVTIVDTNAVINAGTHLADTLHLNQAGAQELADAFRLAVIGAGVLDDGFTPPTPGGNDVTEINKLLADDNEANDRLGYSVAIDGTTAIAGAYSTSSSRAGGAYIFEKSGGTWTQTTKLQPADSAPDDHFGFAVDIDGDTAIVGSDKTGGVHVFVRNAGVWSEQQRLAADDGNATGDQFGFNVAVSGDIAVVGARQDDTVASNAGAVYVFERAAGVWSETDTLVLPGTGDASYDPNNTLGFLDTADNFGWSVDIDGTTVAVGAPWDNVRVGGGSDMNNLGSAHVFVLDQGSWTLEQSLLPSIQTANDQYGLSVSVSGDRLVVGAPFSDPSGFGNAGRVYVLDRSTGTWSETASITVPGLSSANVGENFGQDVSVDGLNFVASAYKANNGGSNQGDAVYATDAGGGTFNLTEVVASDPANADFFGRSVSISGDDFVIGAEREDGTPGTLLGGSAVGAVYAFDAGPDTVPPTWSGGTLTQTGSTASTVDLSWSNTPADAAYYGIFQDGVRVGRTDTMTFTVGGLAQGSSYNFVVEAYDEAGNVSTNGPSVTGNTAAGDTSPPTWPTNTITVSNISTTTADVSWPAATDDTGVVGYILSLDGAPLADGPNSSFNITGLDPETTYNLSVVAYDAAGNQSTVGNPADSFTTETPPDTEAPVWTAATLTASNQTTTTIDLAWTAATDNVAVVDYQLLVSTDGGTTFSPLDPDISGTATIFTAINLTPDTEYVFKVEAIDGAGNTTTDGPTSAPLSTDPDIDTEAPTWTAGTLTGSNETDTTIDLAWSGATDNVGIVDYQLEFSTDGGTTFSPLVPDTTGTGETFTATLLTPETDYIFRIQASDLEGNVSTTGPTSAVLTTLAPPDTEAPTWSGGTLTAANPTVTSIDLSWSGASDNVGVDDYQLSFSIDGGSTFAPLVPDTDGPGLLFTATELTPNTSYIFQIEALDAAANISTGGPTSLALATLPDTAAPTWTGGILTGSNPTATTIDLDWSGASDDVEVTGYTLSVSTDGGTTFAPLTPDVSGNVTSFTATGLTPETDYIFHIEALDGAGNISTTGPTSATISTGMAPDIELPTWPAGSLTAANPTDSSIDLSWSTAIDNVGVVDYTLMFSIDSGVTFAPLVPDTDGVTTTFTAIDLTPSTSYIFQIEASDLAGNVSTTGPTSLALSTLADAQPPTWNAGTLTGSNETDTTIDLAWSGAEDNVAVTGYTLSVSTDGGTTFGPLIPDVGTNVTMFTATGLTPETDYVFRVQALDAESNVSTDGPTSATLTTAAPPDIDPPTWTAGTLTGSNVTDTSIQLDWSGASDNVGIVDFQLEFSTDGGTTFSPLDPDVTGNVLTFTPMNLTPETDYIFRIEASDLAGNVSTTGPTSAVLTTLAPPDTEAPIWTAGSLTGSNPTDETIDLVWSGATDNVGIDDYDLSFSIDGGTTFSPLVPDVVGDGTTFTAMNLVPNTSYIFQIEASDAAGNTSTTGPTSAAVATLPDAQPPTWPAGTLTASNPTSSSIQLDWTAADDNVAVTGYELFVSVDGGTTLAPVAPGPIGVVTTFVVDGLTPDTPYVFKVEAVDAEANASTDGPTSASLSTLPDTEAPDWTAGSITGSNVTHSTVDLSWSGASDNIGVTDYTLSFSTDGGTTFTPLDPDVSGAVTMFTASGLTPETDYIFQVQALDDAGNVSTTGPVSATITTPAAPPPDPITEIVKLVASDADANDNAGYSVAISGDYAVVGSPKHENNNGSNTGAVYVFEKDNTTWVERAILTASDLQAGDFFGWSVAIDGDTIVVGAYGEDQPSLSGSVYVFTGSGSNWTEQAKLKASNVGSGDRFGQDVAIDGDSIVVGAHLEDTNKSNAGSGYVFVRNGTTWTEQGKLNLPTSSDPGYDPGNNVGFVGSGDKMGWSVDISGDTVVLGAPEDTSQVNDITKTDHGTANVFVRDGGGNWTYQATLAAANPIQFDQFGWDVTIDGDRILVGTPLNDFNGGNRVGLVYEFERTGTTWSESNQLRVDVPEAETRFGYSVALEGDRAVIGAPFADLDNGETGAAYAFTKENGSWSQVLLQATDRANADRLGWSVGLGGTLGIAGAWAEDGIAGTEQGGSAAGSAYIFNTEIDETAPAWPGGAALTASNIGVQTIDLAWPAATDATGIDEYIVYQDSVEIGRTSDLFFTATGLTSETSYLFAVAAVDPAGNTSPLLSATIQTIFGDSTPPTWTNPTLTVSNETGSSVELAWSGASDDVLVTSYKIFRDGTEVGEVAGTSTIVGGLASNSTYTFTVEAVDAAGNVSTNGPSAQGTTGGLVPINEIAKLVADDPAANDRMSYAMAIDGDTVVAGAYQRAAGGSKRGSAFVFVNQAGTWVQQAELTASDGANNDFFGWSVDISGDTIVVGAYGDDSPSLSGAAYVFVRSGSTWTEQAKIKPANSGDRAGQSVAIDGETIVIGAHLDDDSATNAGAGYVFVRTGTTWNQQGKLIQPDTNDPNYQPGNSIGFGTSGDNIGWSADIDGDTVVLGAPLDNSTINDTLRTDHGAAYVFVRNGTTWSFEQALAASTDLGNFDQLGYDVAVSGDRVIAGAPFYDGSGLTNSGAAYEFERSGTTWTESAFLTAPDPETLALYGFAVALEGADGVVGAYRANFSGINEPGATYSLTKTAGLWSQSKLVASDAANFDRFGYQVGISGGTIAVGAFAEDGHDGTSQGAAAAGSVYIFDPNLVVPLLSIDDVTVNEGDGTATLTVSIDTPQQDPVSVNYATADGTATAGSDYTNTSGTLNLPSQASSGTIDVPILSDNVPENDEMFVINLSGASEGIGIADATGEIDILNDDGPIPVLTVSAVAVDEGDSGVTQAQLVFDLDRVPPVPVTVEYATADDTATAPSDYTAESGTLTFNGVQQVTEIFEIIGDTTSELDESFIVNLTNPSDGLVLSSTSATVTATNDDGVLPVLSVEAASVVEGQLGQTSVDVTFSLLQPVTEDVTFDFATTDGSATAGQDYLARTGSATITQGTTSTTESFVVFGDIDPEQAETFAVSVSNVLPVQTDVAVPSADVTITNDDFTEVIIDAFAGDGTCCNSGDGGPALDASLNRPRGVRVAANGDVYIAEPLEHVVRKIDGQTGIITTVAGTGVGGYSGDGAAATAAQLKEPYGLAFDDVGNLYIGDIKNNVVRKVDTSGIITTYAGGAGQGFSGDGGPATSAKMFRPMEVEWHNGALYIADYLNHKIRMVDDTTRIITTVVGVPSGSGTAAEGFSGDGGPADQARLKQPRGMAFASDGDLIIADRDNNRVRRVDSVTNIIDTIAGTGAFAYGGDGGPAVDAKLKSPRDVKVDAFDNIYIADTSNRRIRIIDSSGDIETYAGTGQTGGAGDGGPALDAQLGSPYDFDIAANGLMYIADELTSVRKIRVISPAVLAGAPPTWPSPTLTQTGQTTTTVNVSWSAAVDDGSVSGYDIFVDGSQVGTSATTSFTITGLAAGSSYTVTIEAEDNDGNRSTTGPSLVVNTDP